MDTEHRDDTFDLILPSGERCDWLNPERTKIRSRDLEVILSRLPRYLGSIPVSVLEHTAVCFVLARLRWPDNARVAAYCATHDLHEAYVGEWPKGLKMVIRKLEADYEGCCDGTDDHCSSIDSLDSSWQEHVHRSLGLEWPLPEELAKAVKEIDSRAPAIETWFCAQGHPAQEHIMATHGGPPTEAEEAACHWALSLSPIHSPEATGLLLWSHLRDAVRELGYWKELT